MEDSGKHKGKVTKAYGCISVQPEWKGKRLEPYDYSESIARHTQKEQERIEKLNKAI